MFKGREGGGGGSRAEFDVRCPDVIREQVKELQAGTQGCNIMLEDSRDLSASQLV